MGQKYPVLLISPLFGLAFFKWARYSVFFLDTAESLLRLRMEYIRRILNKIFCINRRTKARNNEIQILSVFLEANQSLKMAFNYSCLGII